MTDGQRGRTRPRDAERPRDVDELERALRAHPDVRDAVVVDRPDATGDRQLVAYLSPGSRPREHRPENTARLAQWQAIWENASASESGSDPTFDTSGWASSYTGMAYDEPHVRTWRDAAVAQISSVRPRRVLEIGCGMGLILFQVAPHCERYLGVDFVAETLAHVRETVAAGAPTAPEFGLLQREALDLADLPAASFDLIIINGVTMYFPSVDHLREVVVRSLRLLEPGGAVFVGDVRHAGLLELFHTDVQLFRSGDDVPTGRLSAAILPSLDPRVTGVSIQPKRAGLDNEMTKYRYDVWLRTGPREPACQAPWLDWDTEVGTVAALRDLLAGIHTAALGVRGIPNRWLARDLAVQRWLARRRPTDTIADLHRAVAQVAGPAVDPQVVAELADAAGLHCETSWAAARPDGSFDAAFSRDADVLSRADWPEAAVEPGQPLANNPVGPEIGKQLVRSVREHVAGTVPEHLWPARIVVLTALPKSPDGTVDRAALPEYADGDARLVDRGDQAEARAPQETALLEILCAVLDRDRIDPSDDFFAVGGDSLRALEVLSLVRQRLSVKLPLSEFVACTTVADLLGLVQRSPTVASGPARPGR
jgi:ubiquinone/menaquinone biosynthesis C-methylase UbiE/acyl carrier protein